jgi:hypothetical protein
MQAPMKVCSGLATEFTSLANEAILSHVLEEVGVDRNILGISSNKISVGILRRSGFPVSFSSAFGDILGILVFEARNSESI